MMQCILGFVIRYHHEYVHGSVGLLMTVACPNLSGPSLVTVSGIILTALGRIGKNVTHTWSHKCSACLALINSSRAIQ